MIYFKVFAMWGKSSDEQRFLKTFKKYEQLFTYPQNDAN